MKAQRKKNLLIVDDNVELAETLKKLLQKEEYSALTAHAYEETQTLLQQQSFDLFIIDINLCDKRNGFDVYSLIRNVSTAPVMFLTGDASTRTKVKAFQLGAQDYLCKPFNFLELRERIKVILRGNTPNFITKKKNISFHGYTLNENSNTLLKDGKKISLRKREFEILTLLAKNRGNVITRERILDSIWNDTYINSNTVDVHITNIRKKIPSKIIETKHGLGYKIS